MPLHAFEFEHVSAQLSHDGTARTRSARQRQAGAHVVEEGAGLQRLVVSDAAEQQHALFVPGRFDEENSLVNIVRENDFSFEEEQGVDFGARVGYCRQLKLQRGVGAMPPHFFAFDQRRDFMSRSQMSLAEYG